MKAYMMAKLDEVTLNRGYYNSRDVGVAEHEAKQYFEKEIEFLEEEILKLNDPWD